MSCMHACVCVGVCGCVWVCVGVCGCVWVCVRVCVFELNHTLLMLHSFTRFYSQRPNSYPNLYLSHTLIPKTHSHPLAPNHTLTHSFTYTNSHTLSHTHKISMQRWRDATNRREKNGGNKKCEEVKWEKNLHMVPGHKNAWGQTFRLVFVVT
jgi:hypothetical protein